jgi:hypothetical protein
MPRLLTQPIGLDLDHRAKRMKTNAQLIRGDVIRIEQINRALMEGPKWDKFKKGIGGATLAGSLIVGNPPTVAADPSPQQPTATTQPMTTSDEEETKRFGSWNTLIRTDKMTDEKSYVAMTMDKESGAGLALMCSTEDKFHPFKGVIVVKQTMQPRKLDMVEFRVDSQKAGIFVADFRVHTVNIIGGFIDSYDRNGRTTGWLGGTRLLVRLDMFDLRVDYPRSEKIDFTFPIDGIDDAINYAKSHCPITTKPATTKPAPMPAKRR